MAKKFRIAVIPGDGTGSEVIGEALKALDAASQKTGFSTEKVRFDLGGERYLRTGEVLPEGTIDELLKYDAILLGAVGHPDVKPGVLEKGLLLELRFKLDQYINLRPVILYPGVETPLRDKGPEDINFVVVRENTEGLYAGTGGFLRKGTPQEVAVQESVNTRFGVERCIRFAFDLCRKRNYHKKLTLCGKTNVLTYAFDLWQRTFNEVAEEYPDVKVDYAHVDAICMWMIKDPQNFDVIVTDNMFGDIITDIGAMIQGGLGIAAGGNINPNGVSMFEPIGGSAPKYAGLNIINPIAAIAAAQMMLEHLGQTAGAGLIEEAIKKVVSSDLKSLSAGRMGHSTTEVGDLVVKHINERPEVNRGKEKNSCAAH
jgi:3-isopropylmalate dehydrogenase